MIAKKDFTKGSILYKASCARISNEETGGDLKYTLRTYDVTKQKPTGSYCLDNVNSVADPCDDSASKQRWYYGL